MAQQLILVIGKVWPESASSAAGIRMLQLLRFFLSQNYQVHFCSAARPTAFSDNLQNDGITCSQIQLNDSSFDMFVTQLQPSLVMFDRFTTEEQFGWRVRQFVPNCFHLLDTEDLHGLRHERELQIKNKNITSNSEITLRELSSIFRCDASIIISKSEYQLLQTKYQVPAELLLYLPLLHDDQQTTVNADFQQREHFISIGNFLHAPNKDAVLYLRNQLWPRIHQLLPKAQLLVYGAYADEAILNWSQPKKNFIIKGRAENAHTVMQAARVCLAPLRFGAGQKGKLLLAMQCGTPSVTTDVGAESMCPPEDWPGSVTHNDEDFVQQAVTLYSQPHEWKQAAERCTQTLQHFDKNKHLLQFASALAQRIQHVQLQPSNNITTQLLRYHANHSTKYMALWIEEKNKQR